MDYLIGDLQAVVRSLDEPPVVMGASMGGMTALIAEGENPGLVRGLVLVDVVPRLEEDGVARIKAFMATGRDGFEALEDVADAIRAYNPQRPRPSSLDGLRKNVRLRDDGRWHWHWDPMFMADEDREPSRGAGPERAEAACRGIDVPTLVVRGGHSDVITPDAVRAFQALIPGAEYVEVPDAGHMVVGDDNDVFTEAVAAFLARIPPLGS
jgi:non-heme chloroperoxidase